MKNTELVVQVSSLVARRKVCRGRKSPPGGEFRVYVVQAITLKGDSVMTTSKTKAKDLPASLTDDKKVLSSMKAIQRAGFWALIIALFAPLILILSLVFGGEPNSSLYVLPVIALYLGYSGWKMNRLEGGKSISVMLVINMLLSLLMIFGIFPLLLLIMSLIALVKIGAYQKWRKKSEELVGQKENAKKSLIDARPPEAVFTKNSTKTKKTNHKKLILASVIAVTGIALLAIGGFIGLDYQKFSNHQQSKFFGSKDVYVQGQPLYFDDIKITVTEVEHKNYSYQTNDGCSKLAEKGGALMRANGFVKTPEWEVLSFQLEHCQELADLYENKKMLIVHYFVENTSSQPLDISAYNIKIFGDEKTESTKSENKITTLLANQSRYDSFVIHHLGIDKEGPFALIVSKDGKQKQIQLDLPKIAPFCDLPACKQEAYQDRY